ncbi:MAG: AmmeMemoRadiSam system protein B [Candidatus Marsarchaeota archaeon]|nr:AmmeMemoRadiSam system protein B [Candidatus Marsarchaeota archaeon]
MRIPAVAGSFYPSTKGKCVEFIESNSCTENTNSKVVVNPHAGWGFSGKTAIHSFMSLKNSGSNRFLIIGPSHYFSDGVFLSGQDWKTPLGIAKHDKNLVNQLGFEVNENFHEPEHSIEVQIPFLQYFFKKFTFAALLLGDQSWSSCLQVAKSIPDDVAVIASSDFTHYEPEKTARSKDFEAIELVEKLKSREFSELVEKNNLSICGYGPITIAIEVAKRNCRKGVLLDFSNSGETGRGVVDYVSLAFV